MTSRKPKKVEDVIHHKHAKTADEEKLIHEVTDFIESERKHLEKQVQEKKKESKDWHTRYTDLIGKVSQTAGRHGDFFALEAAGGLESSVPAVSTVELELEQNSAINLSDNEYSNPRSLSVALEDLRKTRSIDVHQTLLLSNCGLMDNSFGAISNFLAHPMLIAVDLSHNQLSPDFFSQFISLLQVCFVL